jgi:hypothetical protein
MQFDGVSLLLVHRPRHRDDGGKHRAIDTANPVWSKYPNALFYQKLRTRPDHHLVLNFTPH